MKKVFLLGGLFLLALVACSKKDDTPPYDWGVQYNLDSAKIVAYIAANNIPNVQHEPGGIFYQVITPGTADKPNAAAYVTVDYVGTLLNKTTFESNQNVKFGLNEVIQGWTVGVPKVGKGGEVNLFLPSGYAYGPGGKGAIQPNAVLIFNIKLKDFTNR